LYDISVFGMVHKWPNSQTGIYRVVKNLATALNKSGRCSLAFSAFEGDWYDYAWKHLESASSFEGARLPHSRVHQELFDQFLKANRRAEDASGLSKLGWRAARKTLSHATKLFRSRAALEESLKNADIFHSPYFSIPNQARGRRHLSTFQTVHDLIAVLHPEYFDNSWSHFKSIVDSIRADDWIICVSQRTKEDLCSYRKDIDPRRVFVTHLGASDWFYPCRDAAKMEAVRLKYKIQAGRYVLSLCTFEPRKNLAHLIRCFSRMVQQEPLTDLRLVLAGSLGWKYESIFEELTGKDESIRSRIIITGRVADEDMAALYSGAIAFVYPSLYEGFGLPPLEAMKCGTPVIVSNTSSLPEVVGNAGLMVDPQDADALCQAMLRVVMDGELREAMSQKSLKQAGKFSWEQCASKTLAAYETAIGLQNRSGFHGEKDAPRPLMTTFAG